MESCPNSAVVRIQKEEGVVEIRCNSEIGLSHISLEPDRPGLYLRRRVCQTTWPPELINYFVERTPFAWVCDHIARHEDPSYVTRKLKHQLFSYFSVEQFAGKRLLDFGCGSGASTFALARMLPKTEIVGLDLVTERIEAANQINSFRRLPNVSFLCSPSGSSLPPGLGGFDFVALCGVYEHLLPRERLDVMPHLWRVLKSRGCIFVNETPHRYAPFDPHSTGLWFLNYMPKRLAHWTVRHFAGRNREINRSLDWNVHLRGGLRGATEAEIIRNLTAGRTSEARILQPRYNGVHDRAGSWLAATDPRRYRALKLAIANVFRLTDRFWGTVPSLFLEVAVEKFED